MELTTHAAGRGRVRRPLPAALAEPLVLMVAPLAPHIAEELWARLGHAGSLSADARFPAADEALAAEPAVVIPVQVNGKVRFRIEVPADAAEEQTIQILNAHPELSSPASAEPPSAVSSVVPGRIVNVVTR